MMDIQCYCKGMSRGTTPSFKFNVCVPILGTEIFNITLRQHGQIILDLADERIIRVDKDTIKIKLSQAETLLFSHRFPIEAQIRTKYRDGAATASQVMEFYLEEIIKEGEI